LRLPPQTDLPEFKWKQFSVIRRFRDFDALHTRLGDAHPGAQPVPLFACGRHNPTPTLTRLARATRRDAGCVIPALPEKRFATKLVTLGPDFALTRCALLDAFLKRCAAHAVLRRSPHLVAFLQADDSAWGAAAAAALPRSEMTLAKQRDAGGPLGSGALKELTRTAAALLVGRPDAADAEYDRVRRGGRPRGRRAGGRSSRLLTATLLPKPNARLRFFLRSCARIIQSLRRT
jgi:hypothetical protein